MRVPVILNHVCRFDNNRGGKHYRNRPAHVCMLRNQRGDAVVCICDYLRIRTGVRFCVESNARELADINNPLLQELSEKCPGTFQHSVQLSNLVAEAAREIGANSQLARAGALYHDIGKMDNPAFFTENQHDVNPHEVLTPEQSAKIVIRHVTDGLKRAEKEKLPMEIRNFILEHHGRNLAKYFYTTACNNNGGNPVDPDPFTYPGPNPAARRHRC